MRRGAAIFLIVASGVTVASSSSIATAASTHAAKAPDPILLVHGFDGSGASWRVMVGRLRAAGYPASRIDAISYDSTASNVDVAQQISRAVDGLRARTGARAVDIVSPRWGRSRRATTSSVSAARPVDAWVSLAGVNEGTIWAYGCFVLTPCQEMVPTSSLLDDLNRDFPPSGATRFGAWWSPCDTAIVPATNAELAGAVNTETGCLGHPTSRPTPPSSPKCCGSCGTLRTRRRLGRQL